MVHDGTMCVVNIPHCCAAYDAGSEVDESGPGGNNLPGTHTHVGWNHKQVLLYCIQGVV